MLEMDQKLTDLTVVLRYCVHSSSKSLMVELIDDKITKRPVYEQLSTRVTREGYYTVTQQYDTRELL